MTQEIFKRYEKKYMLTQKQYDALMPALERQMDTDHYGEYTISNIYFHLLFRLVTLQLLLYCYFQYDNTLKHVQHNQDHHKHLFLILPSFHQKTPLHLL